MGAWNLEFDPAATGSCYKLVSFNGDIFAFCYNGTGAGVWRRTAPNWTQTIASVSRGAVWNGLIWWGVDPAWPLSTGQCISRSPDGVNWTVDIDFGPGAYSHWSAMGGYGSYLYAAERTFQGVPGNTFWRRDIAGNWVAIPPVNPDASHGQDTVGFGSYVYWCDGSDCDRYQVAWASEPTLDGDCNFFCVHNGSLFAVTDQYVYRYSGGTWIEELAVIVPWGFGGTLSEGADGNLYICADDGVNSRVYIRSGGVWTLHSTAAAIFRSAIADVNGNLFAATNSCAFWAYTASFDVSPIGGGLPPQAMDCDGDGNALYVCVYNAAVQPILVKVPLPLTPAAVGTAVFNPAAGTAINVKCSAVGGRLAIAGRLSAGGNDSVQTSEDAGGTFTDISPAWADTAQPLLVDPDGVDEVYVALDAAQDLDETVDGGVAWTQRNAAVGYSPGAMAKLPDGDEVVVGNDGANEISYSPNKGVTLQDITGVFIGNVAALEVI